MFVDWWSGGRDHERFRPPDFLVTGRFSRVAPSDNVILKSDTCVGESPRRGTVNGAISQKRQAGTPYAIGVVKDKCDENPGQIYNASSRLHGEKAEDVAVPRCGNSPGIQEAWREGDGGAFFGALLSTLQRVAIKPVWHGEENGPDRFSWRVRSVSQDDQSHPIPPI